ncbi:MAG: tryptophan-rich sensory protein [Rhodospirillaceae bacterium]|nr:tryptophan-rich sensory protein [Rhodospirillaceae bacterium]
MRTNSTLRMPRWRGVPAYAGLAVALAVCLTVGYLGSLWTAPGVRDWYPDLAKPPITPPNWVFAPVWTALYVLMAVAAWRVWRRAGFGGAPVALSLFGLQLALNLFWSYLFFDRHLIGAATVEIAVLFMSIAATAIAFARIDRLAALLLLPYLAWVGYAGVLTGWIWVLNRA